MVFSALVSRPHRLVTKKEKAPPPEEAAKQVFFFTHFVNMKKEDYEAAFDIMLKDTGLIYGNMARDIYDYGKVIAFKYKLLRYSYNIFIYGLGFTLISFLIALFITKS